MNLNLIPNQPSGTPILYYKNINNFGKLDFQENNIINENLNYQITDTPINDYSKPQLLCNANTPISIGYVNKDLKVNHIISDISTPVTFDGSLLKRGNVTLNSIKCNFSFRINIINNLEQLFTCIVNIDIPLESNEQTIYDGYVKKELNNLNNYKFYRVK